MQLYSGLSLLTSNIYKIKIPNKSWFTVPSLKIKTASNIETVFININ
jgi:hypothetical protein